jgi:F0F1-type ATP synthase assembly protein I
MTNTSGSGLRLVWRVVLLQLVCAALTGLLFGWWRGMAAGIAATTGGVIAAVGSGVFGWRMFAPGIAPAAKLHRAMFAGEALKWFWYVVAIWVCFAKWKLDPSPLLVGLVVAQFGHWIGLVSVKRG